MSSLVILNHKKLNHQQIDMKNILVPTDFSATASNAINVAFDLANDFNATIHLFTCLDIDPQWKNLSEEEKSKRSEEQQKIHNAKTLLQEWVNLAKERNIPITTSYTGGVLKVKILEAIEENDIDFIVMGSHGTSGKNEFFIGSNTQKVVRGVHCPVLVIKEDLKDYVIDKMIFVSNFDEKELDAFQYFLDFTAGIDAEIHLVEINTSNWYSQPNYLVKKSMEKFAERCKDRVCKTHFFRDWSVDAGVRRLTREIGADLIAISNQSRHPIKRMTAGSNVEMLINHAKVPVLSIDFPQNDKESSITKGIVDFFIKM